MADAPPKSYRADEVNVTFGGKLISGYGEDEFVAIAMAKPRVEKTVGADGEVAMSINADKSGEATITLMPTSDSNDVFQDLLDRNERGPGIKYYPLIIRDLNGRAKFSAPHATVSEEPAITYKRGVEMRAWKLVFARRDPGAVRGSKAAT